MTRSGSFWEKRLNAFRDAGRGVVFLVRDQPHARFHLLATLLVLGLAWWLGLPYGDWLALILAIGLVWVAEAINSAIEATVDMVSPDWHQLAGKAKDIAAGAVLLAALCAAAVGVLVFAPHFI